MNFAEVIGLLRKEIRNYRDAGAVVNPVLVYEDLLLDIPWIQMMDGCVDAEFYLAIRPSGFEFAPTKVCLDDRLAILGPALCTYHITWTHDFWYSIDKYE